MLFKRKRKHACIVQELTKEELTDILYDYVAPPKGAVYLDNDRNLVVMSIDTFQEFKDHMRKGDTQHE